MDQINVTSLSSRLTELDVARERCRSAEESLARAKSVYIGAIRILEEAMSTDPTVAECQNEVDEYNALYAEALQQAQGTAICAWEGGFTNGKKEWSQDEWEVRLRTNQIPSVTDIPGFIADIYTMRAYSVIKSITLNKADAVNLDKTAAGGVKGLEVEERTSCSLKKVNDGQN